MTSGAELHHVSSGLLLCLSLTQISRHCSLCRSRLVVAAFPQATLSRRFSLKSACQRPATPPDFHHVNPQRLFIARRSILSFMESNFSDVEAKCSNFARGRKKMIYHVKCFFFLLSSRYEKVENAQCIGLIDTVIHPNYHHLLMNLTIISSLSFTKRKSLNLSSVISSFITKVTTCWSKNILPRFLPSHYPQHPHVEQRLSLWAKQKTDLMLFCAEKSLELDDENNNDTLKSNQFWRQTEVVFKI